MPYIPVKLRDEVRIAARGRCEYCLISESRSEVPHEIDHIIATQHGGTTTYENLCLACLECNRQKGTNLCAIDIETGEVVRLFDLRHQQWHENFTLQTAEIKPLTANARATIRILDLNSINRLEDRGLLHAAGLYPEAT